MAKARKGSFTEGTGLPSPPTSPTMLHCFSFGGVYLAVVGLTSSYSYIFSHLPILYSLIDWRTLSAGKGDFPFSSKRLSSFWVRKATIFSSLRHISFIKRSTLGYRFKRKEKWIIMLRRNNIKYTNLCLEARVDLRNSLIACLCHDKCTPGTWSCSSLRL